MRMRIFFIIMTTMMLSPCLRGDNSKLVAEKVKELKKLNQQVLKQIKDVKKYNGKKIYVKVKVLPSPNEKGKTVLKVEKISVNKIEKKPEDVTGKFIILTGVVENNNDKKEFKVDLSHVLPREDDSASGKKKADSGKTATAGNESKKGGEKK